MSLNVGNGADLQDLRICRMCWNAGLSLWCFGEKRNTAPERKPDLRTGTPVQRRCAALKSRAPKVYSIERYTPQFEGPPMSSNQHGGSADPSRSRGTWSDPPGWTGAELSTPCPVSLPSAGVDGPCGDRGAGGRWDDAPGVRPKVVFGRFLVFSFYGDQRTCSLCVDLAPIQNQKS